MPDFGLRRLGPTGSAAERAEPKPPAVPAPQRQNAASDPEPVAPPGRILAADVPEGADMLGLDRPFDLLAKLAIHACTETPLGIGILGGPGSGKSFALNKLVRAIETHSRSAPGKPAAPYLGNVLVVRIDAADLDGPLAIALADALHEHLSFACPALVSEASQAAEDPQRAAREAFERLDSARQKLAAERLALDGAVSRRAQLAETLLYETAGTQVDAFARTNRGRIRHRLAGLGVSGDPIPAFKDLVHQSLDGDRARLKFALRALWSFKGQAALIVIAILLLLGGFGLGVALAEQEAWLGFLRRNETMVPAATWFEANMSLLGALRQLAFLGAGLALATNVFRALRLVRLVFRGASLLEADLASRQREADSQLGHQARRVESLAAEVEALSRRAGAIERRAGGAANPAAEPSPFGDDALKRQARRFIAAVGALIRGRGGARTGDGQADRERPERIIVVLDHLEAVAPERARDILVQMHRLLGRGFVRLVAADPVQILQAPPARDEDLEKWIQVPLQIGRAAGQGSPAALVCALLDASPAQAPELMPDGRAPVLDEPVSDAEANLLADLAPLAGRSARALKRFVNLYRLARVLCPEHKGMVALFLALDAGGTEAEIAAMSEALAPGRTGHAIDQSQALPRLGAALAAAERLDHSLSLAGARQAEATARLFSFKP